MDKYEYLTGEDLGYKPDVLQRAKSEYSPLGEAFNKVFKKDYKNKNVIKHYNDLVDNSVHKSMTRLEKRNISLKNAEKLLEGIISGKINKTKAKDMYNDIAEDVYKLNKLKPTESRRKVLPIFKQLEEIFMGCKADEEVDDEADDETDDETDEQPDTTDILELESEESTAQQEQGGKILSKQQMTTRLPVLLNQLQAGNNS